MELGGVTFTVQLKRSGTVLNQQDVRKISLGASGDSTLDWKTFKSYVSKNLSRNEEFSLAYVDSSEDELPIESECEFREALRYARQRAQNGLETILKVNEESQLVLDSKTNGKNKIPINLHINGKKSNHSLRCIREKKRGKLAHQFRADKYSKRSYCSDNADLLLAIIDKLQKRDTQLEDTPPPWFRKYMKKFRRKMIKKLTKVFLREVERCKSCHTKKSHSSDSNKSKMKLSDEASCEESDGECDQSKLLRTLEEIKERERKLEKKFDYKLRKLEDETKRMIKQYSEDNSSEYKLDNVGKRYDSIHDVMDVILLNGCKEIAIKPCENFGKEWEVINTGSVKWNERTELRHVWATSGLKPEKTVAACPLLQPGETGTIKMKFIAPDIPGNYTSFWHFYHNGERFGHWLSCELTVENMTQPSEDVNNSTTENTVITPNTSVNSDTCINEPIDQNNSSQRKIEQEMSRHKDHLESDIESDNSSERSLFGSYKNNSDVENFVVIPWLT